MSGFRDPYQPQGGYMGHRQTDSAYNAYDYGAGELFNPYADQRQQQPPQSIPSNPYPTQYSNQPQYSNPYEQTAQQTGPYRSTSGGGNTVERSNTTASRYSQNSGPQQLQNVPPPLPQAPGEFAQRDSDRTLPVIPQGVEPEEGGETDFPSTGFGKSDRRSSVLRKANRASRASYSNVPTDRY